MLYMICTQREVEDGMTLWGTLFVAFQCSTLPLAVDCAMAIPGIEYRYWRLSGCERRGRALARYSTIEEKGAPGTKNPNKIPCEFLYKFSGKNRGKKELQEVPNYSPCVDC
jgi:hypothetical protein